MEMVILVNLDQDIWRAGLLLLLLSTKIHQLKDEI